MENPPCKLSFTHWDTTVTIEKDHSDVTMEELYDMMRGIALAALFSPKTVEEYFDND